VGEEERQNLNKTGRKEPKVPNNHNHMDMHHITHAHHVELNATTNRRFIDWIAWKLIGSGHAADQKTRMIMMMKIGKKEVPFEQFLPDDVVSSQIRERLPANGNVTKWGKVFFLDLEDISFASDISENDSGLKFTTLCMSYSLLSLPVCLCFFVDM
jgi:hypothetical protein